MSTFTIDDLPNEILEYIFHLLPPYEDIRRCMAVNKKWNGIAKHVIPRVKQGFSDAITTQNVTWETYNSKRINIGKRYAHSACRHRDSMYIFGGFTSSYSSFNDLWKLNLSTRTWSRISVEGKCPVPKAGATMVTYGDKLILFGGLLPPMHGILHQNRHLSNHIHIYDIIANKWNELTISNDVYIPGLSGHSSTVHNNKMIVFGGLEKQLSVNDVYSLDLSNMNWKQEIINCEKPSPRYGQSQIFMDENHLMIMGGITNEPFIVFDDAWLLNMTDECWWWRKVDLGIHSPLIKTVWCHPVCKVNKHIIIFKPTIGNAGMYADWFPVPFSRCSSAIRPIKPQEMNLNGKRGILNRVMSNECESQEKNKPKKFFGSKGMREFLPLNAFKTSVIEIHAMDTSHLLTEARLSYVRSKFRPLNCPTDTILYSIIEGNGELIMFGGIQRDIINYDDGSEEIEIHIVNSLHIVKVKRKII